MNNNRFIMEHPGRILLEEFLAPKGVSVWHLAKDIGVPVRRLFEIVQGQRPINADIAHPLAHYLGMSERYWLDLQTDTCASICSIPAASGSSGFA